MPVSSKDVQILWTSKSHEEKLVVHPMLCLTTESCWSDVQLLHWPGFNPEKMLWSFRFYLVSRVRMIQMRAVFQS